MSRLAEELVEKYIGKKSDPFTEQNYMWSNHQLWSQIIPALKELQERCAKEADHYAADASEAMNDEVQAVCERIAARIRSL